MNFVYVGDYITTDLRNKVRKQIRYRKTKELKD